MSTFYKPLSVMIHEVPTIIYPMIGVESIVDRSDPHSIEQHLNQLSQVYPPLQQCAFRIVILWKDQELMSDVWLFQQLENEDAGFTIDCKTFNGMTQITGNGITASDGLIMLGREAEFEETVRKNGGNLVEDFVFGKRPELPGDLNPTEEWPEL